MRTPLPLLCFALLTSWSLASAPPSLADLRARAEKGDARAALELGNLYSTRVTPPYGDSNPETKANAAEALKWWRKAAELGDAEAAFKVGFIYFQGAEGVPKDGAEAQKWHRVAAKNIEDATWWCKEAAYRAIGDAQKALNQLTAQRQAPPAAESPAASQLAAELSATEGERSQPDGTYETVKGLKSAALRGDSKAQARLVTAYLLGTGVPKNEIESLAWLYIIGVSGDAATVKMVHQAEADLGRVATLAAQKRAAEIFREIEANSGPK